jgi:ketosteroid isomerase-like protein
MSEQSLGVVRRAYEAAARGDMEGFLGVMDPDVEWDMTRVDFPAADVRHGPEAVRRHLRSWIGAFEDYRLELGELEEVGDEDVIAVFSEHGAGRSSGIRSELQAVAVWKVRGGRVVRVRFFPTKDDARAEAR